MLNKKTPISVLVLILLLSFQSEAKLVVHEWGTFTSLVGSNGNAQEGMYQEDEILPSFVHNFGDGIKDQQRSKQLSYVRLVPPLDPVPPPRCPGAPKIPCVLLYGQSITQKMETPVVYFYADQPQKVNFDVSFPGGIISQSYPAASYSIPDAIPGVELKNGFAHYEVNILKNSLETPPHVDLTNIYSHARNTKSDLIQIGSEIEKFIFYRGLGKFQTKLLTTSNHGDLSITNVSKDKIPAIFLIYTDGEKYGDLIDLGTINSQNKIILDVQKINRLMTTKKIHKKFLKNSREIMLNSLVKAGLFIDEAKSMINTWENGYFKTPGLRVLYILNHSEVEEILPAQITPQPEAFNRAFVGRIEILLDTTENKILNQILREGINYNVDQLGRLAQPILRRIHELALSKGILTADLATTIDVLISKIP